MNLSYSVGHCCLTAASSTMLGDAPSGMHAVSANRNCSLYERAGGFSGSRSAWTFLIASQTCAVKSESAAADACGAVDVPGVVGELAGAVCGAGCVVAAT